MNMTQYSAGKIPQRRDERNTQLIADYQKHTLDGENKVYEYTMAQLIKKYEISNARIYELLDKNNVERRNPAQKRGKKGRK